QLRSPRGLIETVNHSVHGGGSLHVGDCDTRRVENADADGVPLVVDGVDRVVAISLGWGRNLLQIISQPYSIETPDNNLGRFDIASVSRIASRHGHFIKVAFELDSRLLYEFAVARFQIHGLGPDRVPQVEGLQIEIKQAITLGQ